MVAAALGHIALALTSASPLMGEQADAQMREDREHPSQTVLSADVLAAPLVGPAAPLVGAAGTVGAWLFVFLDHTVSGADMCHLLVDAPVILHLDVARAIHCRTIALRVSKTCIP